MNLRAIPRLFLTTRPDSITPEDPNSRVLMISRDYEVVGALQHFCKRTSIIALRSCGEPDSTALLAEIWATPRQRTHSVVILAPPRAIHDLSMELDQTSWEDASSVLRRGGIMGFKDGRLVTCIPCPPTAEELADRHPVFDIDLD